MVNNGGWTRTPHKNEKRLANFDFIIDVLKDGGMGTCSGSGSSSTEAEETTEPSESETTEPAKPDTSAKKTCPPEGWKCAWPPKSNAYCCSKWGYLGVSDAHCSNGGVNALDSCCTLKADGSISCDETASSGSDDKEDEPFDETAECPPKGWDRCSTSWPPPVDGYCCSSGGWLGDSDAHCNNGGLNAMDKCCKKTKFGHFKCQLPEGACPTPPDVCTGDARIDAVLKKSNIGCEIGLHKLNPIYTWEGFCTAVR